MKKIITSVLSTMVAFYGYSQDLSLNGGTMSGTIYSNAANAVEVTGQYGSPAYMRINQTANSGGKLWRFGHTGGVTGFTSFDFYNESDNVTPLSLSSSGVTVNGALTGTSATFSGAIKFPAFDRGFEANTTGGVSVYSNEINSGSGGVDGNLHLGWRRTNNIYISPPLTANSATFNGTLSATGQASFTNNVYISGGNEAGHVLQLGGVSKWQAYANASYYSLYNYTLGNTGFYIGNADNAAYFVGPLNGTSATFTNHVAIGTPQADANLSVKGKLRAKEIKVELDVLPPDYVFEKEYDLKSLPVKSVQPK